jgi:hypothetical protein
MFNTTVVRHHSRSDSAVAVTLQSLRHYNNTATTETLQHQQYRSHSDIAAVVTTLYTFDNILLLSYQLPSFYYQYFITVTSILLP